MNVKRLIELSNFLRTVGRDYEKKFNISHWRSNLYEGPGFDVSDEALLVHDCGSTACAVGWACAHPVFKDQGLKWNPEGFPTFQGEQSFNAVCLFFDISFDTALRFFTSTYYPKDRKITAYDVADMIDHVLDIAMELGVVKNDHV